MREDFYLTNKFGNHQHYSCLKIMIRVVLKHLYFKQVILQTKAKLPTLFCDSTFHQAKVDISLDTQASTQLKTTKFNKQGNYITHTN